ncbi:hypothetical protein ABPG72_022020 [Tetrahymena utriculariae]
MPYQFLIQLLYLKKLYKTPHKYFTKLKEVTKGLNVRFPDQKLDTQGFQGVGIQICLYGQYNGDQQESELLQNLERILQNGQMLSTTQSKKHDKIKFLYFLNMKQLIDQQELLLGQKSILLNQSNEQSEEGTLKECLRMIEDNKEDSQTDLKIDINNSSNKPPHEYKSNETDRIRINNSNQFPDQELVSDGIQGIGTFIELEGKYKGNLEESELLKALESRLENHKLFPSTQNVNYKKIEFKSFISKKNANCLENNQVQSINNQEYTQASINNDAKNANGNFDLSQSQNELSIQNLSNKKNESILTEEDYERYQIKKSNYQDLTNTQDNNAQKNNSSLNNDSQYRIERDEKEEKEDRKEIEKSEKQDLNRSTCQNAQEKKQSSEIKQSDKQDLSQSTSQSTQKQNENQNEYINRNQTGIQSNYSEDGNEKLKQLIEPIQDLKEKSNEQLIQIILDMKSQFKKILDNSMIVNK